MSRASKIMNRTVCSIMVFMIVLIAVTPMATRAADGLLYLTVRQVYSASSNTVDETFDYRLRPLSPSNPMPSGSTATGYSFSITGNNSTTIGPLNYSRQDDYDYEVFQVIGTEKPGYTYDKKVYTIKVYVEESLDVYVTVSNVDSAKADEIVFENGYGITSTNPDLMIDPPVTKIINGNPGYSTTFAFRLVSQGDSQPMPSESDNGAKTIYITGQGQGKFGKWSYDKTGTYTYKVNELNTNVSGYTYDTTVYTITDIVTLVDGQLVLSRTITDNTNKTVTELAFTNVYRTGGGGGGGGGGGTVTPKPTDPPEEPKPTDPPEEPKPTDPPEEPKPTDPPKLIDPPKPGVVGPKTGDDSNNVLSISLFILGSLLVIGTAMYLIIGRKRRKSCE
ncbi:MAG: VCBS domain-containing protein [Oscillospiraceae bacterium]|nr:VCBS domain-containing protein [Oscillospiraceae bacterium]